MSAPDPSRTPVLVSVGQAIERERIVAAIGLAEQAARAALDPVPSLGEVIDRLSVVAISFSRSVPDPGGELVRRLGLPHAVGELSSHGGNIPQWLVNRNARDIASGAIRGAVIVGAEATRSMRAGEPDANFLEVANANIAAEKAGSTVGPPLAGILGRAEHGIRLNAPAEAYPMFESVLAHRAGRSHEAQRAAIAPLLSRFTQVAAQHPYAWFRKAQTPEEIATVTRTNRLISEPYTRSMNSFPNVDQAAALVMTSLAAARDAGLADACVFPWSGAEAKELQPTQRPDLGASEAMAVAARGALDAAGVGIDEIAHIDLYSCFPVAVEIAAAGLGIDPAGDRELTLTGGLPYFGGPGNNYSTHAIATLVERIRESGGHGYVSANGGYLSKHAAGVYGAEPPPRGFRYADTSDAQRALEARALPVADGGEGEATVEAATVTYGRDGAPVRAPVIATLADGARVTALAEDDVLPELAGVNLIGRRIRVSGSPGRYRPV